jgi:hypothetical protein
MIKDETLSVERKATAQVNVTSGGSISRPQRDSERVTFNTVWLLFFILSLLVAFCLNRPAATSSHCGH